MDDNEVPAMRKPSAAAAGGRARASSLNPNKLNSTKPEPEIPIPKVEVRTPLYNLSIRRLKKKPQTWWRKVLIYKRALIIVLAPALLAFLFLISTDVVGEYRRFPFVQFSLPNITGVQQMRCAYVVLLMAIYWMTEVVPLPVTAFFPVVFFPLFAVVEARVIAPFYLQDSCYLFIGSLLVAVAVEESRLHERLALAILLATGSRPRFLLLGFQLGTAFLSMWLSNVATTALMMPTTIAIIEALKLSDNVNKVIRKDDVEAADHNTPFSKALLLSICYSANIGGIGTLTGTGTNIVLTGQLNTLYPKEDDVSFASWMAFAIPLVIICLFSSWLWLQFFFLGFRNKQSLHPEDDKNTENSTKRILRQKYAELGPFRTHEWMVLLTFCLLTALWFFRQPKSFPGWGDLFPEGYVTDGTTAMFIASLMFFLPRGFDFTLCRKKKVSPFDANWPKPIDTTPLMTWEMVKRRMDWGTVFLVGGGYAMAAGVKFSGLSATVGHSLHALTHLPEFVFSTIAVVLSSSLTEISSNAASGSIFIPIMASVVSVLWPQLLKADEAAVNPLFYILPVTIACSFAFMLPVAHPTNSIVFASGILTVRDMALAGSGLKVICLCMTLLHTYTWGWLMYSYGTVPHWAVQPSNATTIAPL